MAQRSQKSEFGKTTGQIITGHIFTAFNAFNLAIALCLIAVRAYENLLYLGVIFFNILIGIAQEIRAKRVVEKLSLLAEPKARIERGNEVVTVSMDDVAAGDIIILMPGDQVCAECTVLAGVIEANESLLTGESEPLEKSAGDMLLSGSFVVSGTCRARADVVGDDCYASKVTNEAKKYKRYQSDLMRALDRLVKFTSFFIVPLGALLFYRGFVTNAEPLNIAVSTTCAALLGLLPKGLVLLTSVSLVVGVIRLGKKQLLVHELFGIESLARADVLCMDKTGTLTVGELSVADILPLADNPPVSPERAATLLSASFATQNSTLIAIKKRFQSGETAALTAPDSVIEFSSSRGYSAAHFSEVGTLIMGSWEALGLSGMPEGIMAQMELGRRVVIIAHSPNGLHNGLPEEITPVCAITIEDALRHDVSRTLGYFKSQGVTLKIISGDHPQTVLAIAKAAGMQADATCDMTGKTDAEIAELCELYDIFGRVSPEQKRSLIRALKAKGRNAAMLGDGVNDVLALKEADCGIAMASGCDSARRVARMVLMSGDISALPSVVSEGRRVINNIATTAALFLCKTCFTFILSVTAVIVGMTYPFTPLQLSVFGFLCEAAPALILTFLPNDRPLRGGILKEAVMRALPYSAAISIAATAVTLIGKANGFHTIPVSWAAACSAYAVGLALVAVLFKERRGVFKGFKQAIWELASELFGRD